MPGSSTRKTADLVMPKCKNGEENKRYKDPQFCKASGERDMRTTLTSQRK